MVQYVRTSEKGFSDSIIMGRGIQIVFSELQENLSLELYFGWNTTVHMHFNFRTLIQNENLKNPDFSLLLFHCCTLSTDRNLAISTRISC